MGYISGRRPDTFKGKLFKKVVIKSSFGAGWGLHVPYVDPESAKYFFKKDEENKSEMAF